VTLERVDLVRDGGEAAELREHLVSGIYPEAAADVEAVQRAIALCACGLWKIPIEIAGRETAAGLHVAGLDLHGFLERRLGARTN
jgi:hypothetical protein